MSAYFLSLEGAIILGIGHGQISAADGYALLVAIANENNT